MAQELRKKSEEIRTYHAEQAVVFKRIREMVGHLAEIVNKAQLYDQMMASKEPASAKQAPPILVKHIRTIKDLLGEIQKVVPPGRTPRRVLYPGPPGSPTETLYEVVREVALVQNPTTTAGTSQQEGRARPTNSRRVPSGNCSPQVTRNTTGFAKFRRGHSPIPQTSDRSRTSDRARTPIRHRTLEPAATSSRGKGPMIHASPTSPTDCQMVSPNPS